jgi:hypothetical protein
MLGRMDLFIRIMIAGTVLNYTVYKPLFKWGIVEWGGSSGGSSDSSSGGSCSSCSNQTPKNPTNSTSAIMRIVNDIQRGHNDIDPYLSAVAVIMSAVTVYSIVDWVIYGVIPDRLDVVSLLAVMNDPLLL